MLVTFDSLFDIYPDKLRKGAVVGYRKADGTPLEFPCTLETGDAIKDAKGRWTAYGLGLKPVIAEYLDSLRNTKAREAWIGDGFCKDSDDKDPVDNETLESVRFVDDVTEIGPEAFRHCIALTSIAIPDSVTEIGEGTFRWCDVLTSITIPDGVTSIGKQAFQGCSALTSITIPNSVKTIGNRTFYECTGLTSVTIPEGVTSIGDWAFYGCSALTSITIPLSVTSIGWHAFCGCTSLTDVYVDQPESDLLDKTDLPKGCAIHWKQTEAV